MIDVHIYSFPTDYSKGFGGKYGVQTDRVDKSAKGYDESTKTELHPSQKDFSRGFGGKFGVEEDRRDKVNKTQRVSKIKKIHTCSCMNIFNP